MRIEFMTLALRKGELVMQMCRSRVMRILSVSFILLLTLLLPVCGNVVEDEPPPPPPPPSKPDLVDSGSYFEQLIPNPVSWGEDFQALCQVGNDSKVDAGPFYIDVYASVNQTFYKANAYFIARQQVPSMPAWESDVIIVIEPDDMIEFPSIPSGYYYIHYVIDSTNSIGESDESNNVGLCTNGTLYVQEGGGNGGGDDHGDTRQTATPVNINTNIQGGIGSSDDLDYFRFNATSGKSYTIETTLGTLTDSVLWLYNSSGLELDYDDDDGVGLASKISWNCNQTGSYFASVGGYGASTGSYSLRITEGEESGVTGISLNKLSISLVEGNTEQLTATITPSDATNQNVTWSSSDNSKATVSSSGLVTAVSSGTAYITVTTEDGGFTDTCTVTILSGTFTDTNTGLIWQDNNYETTHDWQGAVDYCSNRQLKGY